MDIGRLICFCVGCRPLSFSADSNSLDEQVVVPNLLNPNTGEIDMICSVLTKYGKCSDVEENTYQSSGRRRLLQKMNVVDIYL